MKKILIYIGFAVLISTVNAQEFSSFEREDYDKEKNYGYFNFVQVISHKGTNLHTSSEFEDIFSGGYWATALRVGTQSTGRKEWQRLHNNPQYGLGWSFINLGGIEADTTIGNPSAIYFFYGAPVLRIKKFSFNIDTEVGLSYNFNKYDADDNPYQNMIGATTNLHFCMGFQFYYEISQRLDLTAGFAFMHFSNGRSFTPQKGINLAGLNLGLSYHFNPIKNYTKIVDASYQPQIRPEYITAEKSAFKRHHEFQFMGSMATVQAEPGDAKNSDGSYRDTLSPGPRYVASTISIDYAYQIARKLKLNIGFDLMHDGSVEYLYSDILPQDVTFAQKSFAGYHFGFQYLIERFAFIFNYGKYIPSTKDFEQRGDWYMRVGGRIGITENIDAHIALKTRNGGIADWIEWGAAYKLKVKKKTK